MPTAWFNKKLALVVSLSLVIAATAFDAQAVIIRGSVSCGTWIKERQEKQIGTVINERWIVGFLSGMAFHSDKDILKGTDNASIFLWFDNYCQANPLKNMIDGADSLFDELVKQKKL